MRTARLSGYVSAAILFVLPLNLHGSVLFTDDFNDNLLNPSLWIVMAEGNTAVNETNQRLQLSTFLPNGEVGVVVSQQIGGDFDAQTDFWLLSWSQGQILDGMGICFFREDASDICVGRTYDSYHAELGDGGVFSPTSDANGRLRLARESNVLSAYYWADTDWQLLHSVGSGPTDDGYIALAIGVHANTTVAFDNSSLTADHAVPEPQSSLLTVAGLAVALLYSRRVKCER